MAHLTDEDYANINEFHQAEDEKLYSVWKTERQDMLDQTNVTDRNAYFPQEEMHNLANKRCHSDTELDEEAYIETNKKSSCQ